MSSDIKIERIGPYQVSLTPGYWPMKHITIKELAKIYPERQFDLSHKLNPIIEIFGEDFDCKSKYQGDIFKIHCAFLLACEKPIEAEAFSYYFGLDNGKKRTLWQVAKMITGEKTTVLGVATNTARRRLQNAFRTGNNHY